MRLREQILTKNDCYKSGRKIQVKGVMVHSTGANNPWVARYVPGDHKMGYNTGGTHWDRPGIDKCVHAFVGKFEDGAVGTVRTLPWNHRGWHAGKGTQGSANNTHIGFEICEDGLDDPVYFQAAYGEAVELTAMLCREYKLNPLADGVVICHAEGHKRGIASNHGDVLHWFPRFGKDMDTFRADVARELEGDSDMTQEQFDRMMDDYLARRARLPASGWAKPFIQTAIGAGVMSENSAGTIDRPQAAVSREELAVVAAAILGKM